MRCKKVKPSFLNPTKGICRTQQQCSRTHKGLTITLHGCNRLTALPTNQLPSIVLHRSIRIHHRRTLNRRNLTHGMNGLNNYWLVIRTVQTADFRFFTKTRWHYQKHDISISDCFNKLSNTKNRFYFKAITNIH